MKRVLKQNLPIGVFLLLLGLGCFWWFGGFKPKAKDLPGTYGELNSFGGVTYRLDSGGTFTEFDGRRETSRGHWHITDEDYLFDTGIELDRVSRISTSGENSGASADEYRLTTRGKTLCWEVHRDEVYWCKLDSAPEIHESGEAQSPVGAGKVK